MPSPPSEFRATGRLALPMMLGQGAQMAMHVLDTAMVGHLGVGALAASAMGNNAAALFFFTGIALGTTVPVLAARAYGAGDSTRMNLVLRHGLTVSFLYSLFCLGAYAVLAPRVLPWFGAPELVQQARPYSLLLIASLVPALLVQNLRGFSEAQNHPWLPVSNIALGVAFNGLLNYGLIYGHFGLPAFGLPGAALGTLLARGAMLLHYVWVLRRHRKICPRPGVWRPVPWRDSFYGDYLRLAVPTAAMIVVWIGNGVAITAMMGKLGASTLAAHEIVRQICSLLFTLSVAFQSAIAIRVAQAVGRRDLAAVQRVAWSGVQTVGAGMLSVALALILARHEIPGWFLPAGATGESPVFSLAASFLVVAGWCVVAEGISLACIGVFRGLAEVRTPGLIYLISIWLLGVPLAFFLGRVPMGGGIGIWQGVVAGNALSALILVVLLAHRLAALRVPE